MNKVRQPQNTATPAEDVKKEKSQAKTNNVARNFINIINVFSYFDRRSVVKLMPFLFFLTALAMLYIANSYYAEHTVRDIDKTEKDLKELRSEFITGKSELMYRSKLSEVATVIQPINIKESTSAPKKILLRKSTKSQE
jgi:hypothetical protein